MNIDLTFPSKIFIKGFKDEQVPIFIKNFIQNAWMEHDAPENMRPIKGAKKLTLEMLPKDFNVDEIVVKAMKKGLLFYDKIGTVNVWINLLISKAAGTNPGYKIEIDKFAYEKDGNNLKSVIDKSLVGL